MSERRGRFRDGGRGLGPGGICWCPNCGYQEPHKVGIPCFTKICVKCGQRMIRNPWVIDPKFLR